MADKHALLGDGRAPLAPWFWRNNPRFGDCRGPSHLSVSPELWRLLRLRGDATAAAGAPVASRGTARSAGAAPERLLLGRRLRGGFAAWLRGPLLRVPNPKP